MYFKACCVFILMSIKLNVLLNVIEPKYFMMYIVFIFRSFQLFDMNLLFLIINKQSGV